MPALRVACLACRPFLPEQPDARSRPSCQCTPLPQALVPQARAQGRRGLWRPDEGERAVNFWEPTPQSHCTSTARPRLPTESPKAPLPISSNPTGLADPARRRASGGGGEQGAVYA